MRAPTAGDVMRAGAVRAACDSYIEGVKTAVLVPVKGFSAAKQRLSDVLSPDERMRLAEWLADRVVAAVADFDTFVACDDEVVRSWAIDRGATPLWGPGLGLNGAVDDGVARIAALGFDHVIVAHADLPYPAGLTAVARQGVTTIVPDQRRDGTNVLSFPTDRRVDAAYGAHSFGRHLAAATSDERHVVEVRPDLRLSLDIDTRSDLTHPLTSEVLPSWLPTIPVNHFTHGS
jgi:2-phospho-L-lactate/phosphoenolpyruvate guanylyltransferase